MDIVIMVLDLIHVHVFHWQMVNEVKVFLFLLWTIVHQEMLLIEKKKS